MQFLNQIIPEQITEALGWTILHSLWQGAAIVILIGLLMVVFRKQSAKFRYKLAYSGMLLMFVTAIVTFIVKWNPIVATPEEGVSTELDQMSLAMVLNLFNGSGQPTEVGFWEGVQTNAINYFNQNIPLFVTIWLMGMLLMSLRFMGGLIISQRIRHYRIVDISADLQLKIYKLANKIHLDKTFDIVGSEFARVPMVTGWFRPVLIVPVSMFVQLPYEQVEAILVHELAHIRRNDYLQNIIQSLIEVLFFYHPAIWWLSSLLRQEREHICDDAAIKFTNDPMLYAKALASLQEMNYSYGGLAPALFKSKNQLLKRIQRMLNNKNITPSFRESIVMMAILVFSVTAIATTNAIPKIDNSLFRNLAILNPVIPDAMNEKPTPQLRGTDSSGGYYISPGVRVSDSIRSGTWNFPGSDSIKKATTISLFTDKPGVYEYNGEYISTEKLKDSLSPFFDNISFIYGDVNVVLKGQDGSVYFDTLIPSNSDENKFIKSISNHNYPSIKYSIYDVNQILNSNGSVWLGDSTDKESFFNTNSKQFTIPKNFRNGYFFSDSNDNWHIYNTNSYPDTIRNMDSLFFESRNFKYSNNANTWTYFQGAEFPDSVVFLDGDFEFPDMPDFPDMPEPYYIDAEDFSYDYGTDEFINYGLPYGDLEDVDVNVYNRALFFSGQATKDYINRHQLDSAELMEVYHNQIKLRHELSDQKVELNKVQLEHLEKKQYLEQLNIEKQTVIKQIKLAKKTSNTKHLKKAQKAERKLIKLRKEAIEELKESQHEYQEALDAYNKKMFEVNGYFYGLVDDPLKFKNFKQSNFYTPIPYGGNITYKSDEYFPHFFQEYQSPDKQKDFKKHINMLQKKHILLQGYHKKLDSISRHNSQSEILNMEAKLKMNQLLTELKELKQQPEKNKEKILKLEKLVEEEEKVIAIEAEILEVLKEQHENYTAQENALEYEILNLEEQIQEMEEHPQEVELIEQVEKVERIRDRQKVRQEEHLREVEERLERVSEVERVEELKRNEKGIDKRMLELNEKADSYKGYTKDELVYGHLRLDVKTIYYTNFYFLEEEKTKSSPDQKLIKKVKKAIKHFELLLNDDDELYKWAKEQKLYDQYYDMNSEELRESLAFFGSGLTPFKEQLKTTDFKTKRGKRNIPIDVDNITNKIEEPFPLLKIKQMTELDEQEIDKQSQVYDLIIEQLYMDGLADTDEDLLFTLEKNKMIINKKELSSKIRKQYQEKYEKLYKEILGKEAKYPFTISIDN